MSHPPQRLLDTPLSSQTVKHTYDTACLRTMLAMAPEQSCSQEP